METIRHFVFDSIILPCIKEAPSATLIAGGLIVVVMIWIARETMRAPY